VAFEGMVHALEESWRVLRVDGRLVDLRPTSPSWKVEVISQGQALVVGEFDDPAGRSEDAASNQAISEMLHRRRFSEEKFEIFEYEYYWDSVDGMVKHIEDDWLGESKVPEFIIKASRRLMDDAPGYTEIRIKRKMIFGIYSKLVK
jgi:hypothetical protein